MSSSLLNYGLYQTGWLAAVLGAASGHPWAGGGGALALLAAHLWLVSRRRAEWALVAVAGAMGLIVDSTQAALGFLTFPAGSVVPWLCPPWIVVMWMQFATTFRFSLRWLVERPGRAAAAGAVGGPIAYAVGARLGAVELHEPLWMTLGTLGIIWTVAVPLLAQVAGPARRGEYRLWAAGAARKE